MTEATLEGAIQADKVAADTAAAAAKVVSDKAAADAALEATKEQTVPFSRFQAVIGQKAEETRANEALRRELKLAQDTLEEFRALGTKKGETTPVAGPKALSAEELQRLVSVESERQQFDRRCNESVTEGKKAHVDFEKVVLGDLTSISPVAGQNGRPVLPVSLVEAALETGNAHEVLYALGKDVNEASRIMSLRPTAQAVALAKFAEKLGETVVEEPEVDEEGKPVLANVSKAPAPIKAPVKPGAVKPSFSFEDTENFSTEEWIRQRESQIKKDRESGLRRH